jgi:hypothetical protein
LPDEATALSFYSQPLLDGVVFPAAATAAVLLLAWRPWRRGLAPERTAWGVGLALAAGYLVGHVGVEGGRPPWPPREAVDRLWYLTFAAAALSLLDGWRRCPAWPRWLLRAALWLGAVWALALPALLQPGVGEAVPTLLGLGAAGLLFWAALAAVARRLPGAALPLALLPTAAGTAVLLYRCHSARLAQLAGVVTAALLPVLARSCARPALTVATAPVVLLLPGLWLMARFYCDPPAPVTSLALLTAAALAAGGGCLPGVRRRPAWQRNLLAAALATSLAVLAVAQVGQDSGPGPLVRSRQLQGRFQTVIELLLESVGKVADCLADVALLRRQEVVAGDQRGMAEAGGRLDGRVDERVARVTPAAQVACDHGDDGLAKPLVVTVVLPHDRRSHLGARGIGVREFDHDDVTTSGHDLRPYCCWYCARVGSSRSSSSSRSTISPVTLGSSSSSPLSRSYTSVGTRT